MILSRRAVLGCSISSISFFAASYHFFYYSVRDFPAGECLFFETDYKHILVDNATDGIIYRDDIKHAWIIHSLYTAEPFEYKNGNYSNVKKVKLRKCNGGIIIDGIPYGFEKRTLPSRMGITSLGKETIEETNVADKIVKTIDNNVRPQFIKLKELFVSSDNFFLSDDDIKLAKKYLTQCEKKINATYVKAQNASKILS